MVRKCQLRAINVSVASVHPRVADGRYRVDSGQTWKLARASYDAVDPERTSQHRDYLTGVYALGLIIRLAFEFQPTVSRQLISVPWKRESMHKTPAQIARSLRAFRNAHKLGLLRSVRISPGRDACNAARWQTTVEYMGNVVPRLPLAKCTQETCECKYVPVGGGKIMDRLRAIVDSSSGRPSKPR